VALADRGALWRTVRESSCFARHLWRQRRPAPRAGEQLRPPLGMFIPFPVPGRTHDAAGFGSAQGRFHIGHTVSLGDSQNEWVTGRLLLAVVLTTVLLLDYLTSRCRAVRYRTRLSRGKTRAGLSVPLAMTWACAPVRVGPSSGASGRVVGGLAARHMGAHVGPEAGSDILLSLQSAESQEPPEEARAHVS